MGQHPPTMAPVAAASGNQRTWVVSGSLKRLFTNRSNRPGDDMKDELHTDGDPIAWRTWRPGFLVEKQCIKLLT